ncbi:hypothetical protein VTL71DRAFT_11914 [Oculimacula yallundae]|uniref:Uncharacterized protein n=1 Tax=Oculimacula yallundae TaxID=86028 RepID=A0ABR4CTU0_9HELO
MSRTTDTYPHVRRTLPTHQGRLLRRMNWGSLDAARGHDERDGMILGTWQQDDLYYKSAKGIAVAYCFFFDDFMEGNFMALGSPIVFLNFTTRGIQRRRLFNINFLSYPLDACSQKKHQNTKVETAISMGTSPLINGYHKLSVKGCTIHLMIALYDHDFSPLWRRVTVWFDNPVP